jgi:hypothetical protein
METVLTNHPVIGIAAASRRVGVSDRRIRQLLDSGEISGQRLDPDNPDSPWAVDIDSLDAWAKTPQKQGFPRGIKRS